MNEIVQPQEHGEQKYWAFVSYSHRDRKWGEWLHRRLETFRVPRRLVDTTAARGPVPERLFPIFRDREELPVSADLGRNIDEALRLSRYLVVICSPAAAKSRWVNEEILTFKRLGRSDRVLALIVDGEPNASDGKPGFSAEQECFPEALRFAMGTDGRLGPARTEPIAADLRPGQDGLENAFLKLVAGIIGVNFDDLRQREHERKLRRLRIGIAASSLLVLLFAVLGVALFFQRNYARMQKNRAEAALEEVRQTLSYSDYLQSVDAIGKGATPDALAFLARAVRTNPRNAAAAELLISVLGDQRWLLPVGRPLRLGDEIGIAVFDRQGGQLFVSDGMDDWRVLDPASGKVRAQGRVTPSKIARAAFSPDGRRIAVASGPSESNVVRVWDVESGGALTGPVTLKGVVTSIAFSPDGGALLTTNDNHVEQHDSRTGAESWPPIDHGSPAMCAVFTPDGSRIVSASLFETFIWNAATRQQEGAALKHDAIPQSFSMSPEGDRLAIALGDGTGRIFTLPDCEPLGPSLPHRSDVNETRFSASGEVLLTCSNDRTAVLWDAFAGSRQAEPMRHEQPVIAAAFTPAGDAILTVSGGLGKPAHLHRWSLHRSAPLSASLTHEAPVLSFSISADGARIVTGSADGRATVWDARTHAKVAGPMAHDIEVGACAFSPDNRTIATAAGRVAMLWDATSGKTRSAPLAHDDAVTGVSFSPDGRRLLTACLDATARLWNAANGEALNSAIRHDGGVLTAEFSRDGGRIVTGSNDGTARLWDAAAGTPLGEPMRHMAPVSVAHFSPDGHRVVTGSTDGVARVWDAHTGRARTSPLMHDRAVTDAVFSADSRMVITAVGEFGGQGSTRAWDAEDGRPLTDPMLHPDGVETAALHPDGERLVTGAFDGMLRVWDRHTGKARSIPVRFGHPIVCARFSPRAPQLAVASGNAVTLLDLVDSSPAAPGWLAEIAERIGGLRFNAHGLLEPVPLSPLEDLRAKLPVHEPQDDYERFGRWFLADQIPASPGR